MSAEKTKKKFGILLATILLFQLSYHTVHVFTQHSSDNHIEHSTHDTQIDTASVTCELCAKLLGHTQYFTVYPTVLLGKYFPLLHFNLGESIGTLGVKKNHLLRGPPSHFVR